MIGSTISHYEILSQLGSGGMGVVYKARDTRLDRLVALKFLPPDLSRDKEANERFMQEAKAASALHHPNICAIYDIKETDDGRFYIVMPLYEGQTLKYRLRDENRKESPSHGTGAFAFSVDQALDIAHQMASGLAAAHEKGIVHRDIKPANIMLTDRGEVVVLDFGVAKLAGGLELTKTGSTIGTAHYMSPEQIRGERVDQRSDLWSMGVVLYQILTGRRPFDGDYEQAIAYGILNNEPPDIRSLRPDVPTQVSDVIRKLLSKDVDARFQSAQDFAAALPSSTASFDAPLDRPSIPPRAHRPHFLLGKRSMIGVAVLLIGLTGAIFWQRSNRSAEGPESAATERTRLVVLPFDNLGAPDDEYFSDGMTEEITLRLSSVSGLAVISRNTAARYKNADKSIREIGQELDVDYVLGGTVRWDKRAGGEERVRIAPQLIRVADDTNVWSEIYDRTMEGVFAIQTEVAEKVVDQLDVTLGDKERDDLARLPTKSLDAYQAYLRGQAIMQSEVLNPQSAIGQFETAVSLDSSFVEAAYGLAHAVVLSIWLGNPADRAELLPKAEDAVARISRIAPGSIQEHLARGYQFYYLRLDFKEALEEFEKALAFRPDDPDARAAIAYIKRRLGNPVEAAHDLMALVTEDPQDFRITYEMAETSALIRDYVRADEFFERAIRLHPTQRETYCGRARNMIAWTGDAKRARDIEDSAPETSGSLPCWWADLAERRFDAIIASYADVTPDQLGQDGYGGLFRDEAMTLYFRLAMAYRFSNDKAHEQESWARLLRLFADGTADIPAEGKYRNSEAVWVAGLAMTHAGLGHTEEARELLRRLREGIRHDMFLTREKRANIALAYALIGDKKEAIDLLEEDLSDYGYISVPWLALPYWDSLRDEPRFKALNAKR
ncbi:MAG: protein kinase [Rhodothermales bacterium]